MYVRSGRAVRDYIIHYGPRRPGHVTIAWDERIDSLKGKTFAGYTFRNMSLGVLPLEMQMAIVRRLKQSDRQRVAQTSRALGGAVQAYHLVDARAYYNDAPDHVWQDEQVLMYVRSGRAVRDRITRYSPRRPGYATIGWDERIDSLKRKTFAGYTFRHVEPTVHQCHPQ